MGQDSGIGVLDKSVAILQATTDGPASLAELVERTGIPRATAHRLALALLSHRLVSRDADGRFSCGPRLAELAAHAGDPLLTHAPEVLTWLRDASGESAQLYVRDGQQRVCIAAAERVSGLRTTVPLGARFELTAGSGAQVLCAWGTEERVGVDLGAAQFTQRTLSEVRRRGWAQSVGQREAGVASVSAPVFSPHGRVIAAVSISGPIERLGRNPGQRYADVLIEAADRFCTALR